jgi:hypothetical protein
MKAFRVYKPALECANFLEVRHFDSRFIHCIGKQVAIGGATQVTPDAVLTRI